MGYICIPEEHCVIYTETINDFIGVVLSSHEVRRFVNYTELLRYLLYVDKRYDWSSTHHRLDMFLIQLWKLIYISKNACEVWVPGRILSCYELFQLKRLEDVLKLAKEFKDETKKIRRMVHNTIGYVVNSVLDDIIYSRVEYSRLYGGIHVTYTHYFNRESLEVNVDISSDSGLYSFKIDLGSEYEKLRERVSNPRDLIPDLLVKRAIRHAVRVGQRSINPYTYIYIWG